MFRLDPDPTKNWETDPLMFQTPVPDTNSFQKPDQDPTLFQKQDPTSFKPGKYPDLDPQPWFKYCLAKPIRR